jgi:hypothetical protein
MLNLDFPVQGGATAGAAKVPSSATPAILVPGSGMQQHKRQDRKIDWSPDYRYVLVPSLDD